VAASVDALVLQRGSACGVAHDMTGDTEFDHTELQRRVENLLGVGHAPHPRVEPVSGTNQSERGCLLPVAFEHTVVQRA
jgi:hypothetical protein